MIKKKGSIDGISFTDEELDGIDITNNHLFIHLEESYTSRDIIQSSGRNSSQGSVDREAEERAKIREKI